VASNVNFTAGQTVANAVVVPVSTSGEVCFYAHAETDVLADVNGWFAAGGGFVPLTPFRLFDSRPSEPAGAIDIVKQRYGGGKVLTVELGGVGGIPAGATAVSLNVTATQPIGDGFVSVHPCGDPPLASNVNFRAGQTVPNAVITPLAGDGTLCFLSNVEIHLIADVNGYFEDGSSLHTLTPTRLFDTRPTEPAGPVQVVQQPLGPTSELIVHLTGLAGIPVDDVGAVSLNVIATNTQAPGFVTVHPCGDRPLASNVNFLAGQTVANAVLAPLSVEGDLCFYAHADVDLVVDVNGWFAI
jgi:hypothetical protein